MERFIELPGTEIDNILKKAFREEDLTPSEGERLLKSSGREVEALLEVANKIREKQVGEVVTYVINRNINFTNICKNSCKFCAFRKPRESSEAYLLDPEGVADKTRSAIENGATEICIQGGLNPELGFEDYLKYVKAARKASPEVHIHAFSPAEINRMAETSDLNLKEIIEKLRSHGLDSVPGTAAEILVERVRKIICPKKIGTGRWEEIIKTCHELGVPTTATIMYGHVENYREIALHLAKLRDIQRETGGFTELVPLALASGNTALEREGLVKDLESMDHLKIHAVARLMLAGDIDNIQTSWVKLGPKLAQKTLNAGANDFSGTLMEENITKATGKNLEEIGAEEMRKLIEEAGKTPKQRTTTYGSVETSGQI